MQQLPRRRPSRNVLVAVTALVVLLLTGVAGAEVRGPADPSTAAATQPVAPAAPGTTAPSPADDAAADTAPTAADDDARWVSAWQGSPTTSVGSAQGSCPAGDGLSDQTVRNVVQVSTGGTSVRVRVSNAFGTEPLQVGAASVAVAGAGADVVPGTLRPLSFAGRPTLLVPEGSEALSDPVPLDVQPLQRLALSVFLPDRTGPATQHPIARGTNYLAASDRTQDDGAGAFDTSITCWLFASGVDLQAPSSVVGTVVTLGDSITDGERSSPDAAQRYPDWLARRLAALPGDTLAVSNAGISGNELIRSLPPGTAGAAAAARLERDVLGQSGVRAVVLLEGINDIGAAGAQAGDLIAVYRQLVLRAHDAGLPVYGGTLTPFGGSAAGGSYGTPGGEAQRQAVNEWIRSSGAFDGVVDFDAALRDPADPAQLLPVYDSGDHLHPSDAGYRAMAEAVDLQQLLDGATARD
jgi:lysophospholipase L1-like esterase